MSTCQRVYVYRMQGDTKDSKVQCTLQWGHQGNHKGVVKNSNGIKIGVHWTDADTEKKAEKTLLRQAVEEVFARADMTLQLNDWELIKEINQTWLDKVRQQKENIWRNETVSPSREATQIRAKIMQIDELKEECRPE